MTFAIFSSGGREGGRRWVTRAAGEQTWKAWTAAVESQRQTRLPHDCTEAPSRGQGPLPASDTPGAGSQTPGESCSKAQACNTEGIELAGNLLSSDRICDPYIILENFKILIFGSV